MSRTAEVYDLGQVDQAVERDLQSLAAPDRPAPAAPRPPAPKEPDRSRLRGWLADPQLGAWAWDVVRSLSVFLP